MLQSTSELCITLHIKSNFSSLNFSISPLPLLMNCIFRYENALRQIVPGVTIPYFAGDLDEPLRDSTQSVLFCERFFGNGNGVVTSGPYANWSTPSGPLVRNYGDDGELWTREGLQRILNKTRNAEIIAPNAEEEDNLEDQHGCRSPSSCPHPLYF